MRLKNTLNLQPQYSNLLRYLVIGSSCSDLTFFSTIPLSEKQQGQCFISVFSGNRRHKVGMVVPGRHVALTKD